MSTVALTSVLAAFALELDFSLSLLVLYLPSSSLPSSPLSSVVATPLTPCSPPRAVVQSPASTSRPANEGTSWIGYSPDVEHLTPTRCQLLATTGQPAVTLSNPLQQAVSGSAPHHGLRIMARCITGTATSLLRWFRAVVWMRTPRRQHAAIYTTMILESARSRGGSGPREIGLGSAD